VPELNDGAKDAGRYGSLEELRNKVRERRQQRQTAQSEMQEKLVEMIIQNVLRVPAVMVNKQTRTE
jgi:FKBP-type peptidyl-prolyl cis-trans isomerase (trigger factor)